MSACMQWEGSRYPDDGHEAAMCMHLTCSEVHTMQQCVASICTSPCQSLSGFEHSVTQRSDVHEPDRYCMHAPCTCRHACLQAWVTC